MNKPDILERLYNHPCEDNPDYGPLLCGLRVEAAEEIKTLRVRIAAFEAALRPFADDAKWLDKVLDDRSGIRFDLNFTVGDLRAARVALEKKND